MATNRQTREYRAASRLSCQFVGSRRGDRSTFLSQPARLPLHVGGSPGALYVTELLQLPYLRRNNEAGEEKREKIKEVLTRLRYFG
jgi:hypothetical protein